MTNFFNNIIAFFKLSNNLIITGYIFVITCLLLFLPNTWITILNLNIIKEKFKYIISLSFIGSISVLFVNLINVTYNNIKLKIVKKIKDSKAKEIKIESEKKIKDNYKKVLMNLDLYEKTIVIHLFIKTNKIEHLPECNSIIIYLKKANIISEIDSSQYSTYEDIRCIYILEKWVIETLREDKEFYEKFYNEIEKDKALSEDLLKEIILNENKEDNDIHMLKIHETPFS